jgi:deazaflavin-dependent oxidoreductase (nitroreductase family)
VPSDRFYSRLSHSLGATGLRWVGKLNAPLYRLSGGRIGGKVGKAPVLLLTTTGRKSGQKRTAPVVYLQDGERMVVINTNAGNAKVPAWSLNLAADPHAEVEVGKRKIDVVARVAEGEERAELWRKHIDQYAGFDDYDAVLDREPKVIVLDPAPTGVAAKMASRSICASGRRFSFFSVLFSIWRIRSRVTPKVRPTSSRVSGSRPVRP